MIQNTKCECGHQNRVGTVLCEACGKPLYDSDQSTEPLEMRYDGVARRSQKSNPNFIDRIWNFFSSVKVAVYLIIITLVGAMFGTIFEQESNFVYFDPSTFYKQKYGTIGDIYYKLGLSHTYESWWFVTLLVMIGASLVICSLDRVLPLYKALSRQKIRKHRQFLIRQRVVYEGPVENLTGDWISRAVTSLKKKGYRVKHDEEALLVEKQRFSRWGPYIIHIGLIIFLLAILFRGLPGLNVDKHYWFPEGEITKIPDSNLYLKNEGFTVEYYPEEELPEKFRESGRVVPKLFETKAVLYQCTADCDDPSKDPLLEEVKRHDIRVNDPLNYNGFKVYQFDFDLTPKLRSVTPSLVRADTGESYGKFKLSMTNSEEAYQVGPYTLELSNKYMDFDLNEEGKPVSKSNDPNAPAFLFVIKGPDLPEAGVQYIYFPKQIDKERFQQDAINERLGGLDSGLALDVLGMEDVDFIASSSYLNIRVDRVMPFVWIGLGIVMLGLVLGFYWHHRRIWLRLDGQTLILGAHTAKNWFGLRREVARFLQDMGVDVDEKHLENRGNQV
ncbi:cytochrome c biogenesis protein ResB [Paenibacillus apis]|uniref:Cytochrome c biogenesis protein ResB n=1 Tax=Paenibacillus apis TaxID=1792174 RepID=A0A920CKV2_9BACL|nr:cytochrome c biogenesis protein ResB [Paenibacillus apis]GIO42880.1 cytochrome c biogenesis protein ResB [Paenibacillus apis]